MTDPIPIASPPPEPATPVTLATLQERALDLLKNPVVLAGGAVVVGLLLARLLGGQKVRDHAVDLLKNTLAPAVAAPTQADPEPVAAPETAAAPWLEAGKQILASVAPNLADQLKKRLAEILPNQHN